jgi:hypothetical protein
MKKAPHVIGPLWLPPGSVRALLAFFVVFVTCWLMVRDEELPLALSEALFTVLAYYFATRAYLKAVEAGEFHRTGSKEFAAMARGFSEATANPLYLPVGTIRVAVILAFVGVALYLAYSGGLNKLLSATTLLLVFAFFAGQIMKRFIRWYRRGNSKQSTGAFEHIRAGVGVAIGLAFVAFYVSGYYEHAPPQAHKVFLAFIIFYFGSR